MKMFVTRLLLFCFFVSAVIELKSFSNFELFSFLTLRNCYGFEQLLQRKEYFGQYGKVTKLSLSRTAGGTVQQFVNDTCSV